MRDNRLKMPISTVQGQIVHCSFVKQGLHSVDGEHFWIQMTGGIVHNIKIGDPCTGWIADHVEPGVVIKNPSPEDHGALMGLSCICNPAVVRTGDVKGAEGFVTGKHENIILYFPKSVLKKLTVGDRIDVFACGQGMSLLDYSDITLRSLSPELLDKLGVIEEKGKLKVGVAKVLPGCLMGSGTGANNSACGDYDLELFDTEMVEKYNLNGLRLGDIVAVIDSDARYGYSFRTGAVTIGVIIHGNSVISGHGPGVTALMSSKTENIVPYIDETANLYDLFVKNVEEG